MTMKPSNFTLNSDYLSIAQTSTNEYLAAFGGGTIEVGGFIEQSQNFTASTQAGAVDRILISKDNGDYMLGSYMSLALASGDINGFVRIFHPDSNTIRAQLVLENYSGSQVSYPTMVFRIKVASFKPPNVF